MGKYDKHFISRDKTGLKLPGYRHDIAKEKGHRIVYLDNEVFPGSDLYVEAVWFWPRKVPPRRPGDEPGVKAHTHPFDEAIVFMGTNWEDIHDLGGEIELWIADEQYIINKSFFAFVPAGTVHCPLNILRIDRPIFHFTAGPSKMYV